MIQHQLFKEDPRIRSINTSQDKILQDIITLHVPAGKLQLDMTYGYGGFYKTILRPEFVFDSEPKRKNVVQADCRDLPVPSGTINSAIFDPPFVVYDQDQTIGKPYLMAKRFSCFKSIAELREMYLASVKEACRILIPGGILVIKCQDTTHGKKNYPIHQELMNMCDGAGFRFQDLFILENTNVFASKITQQRTARKHHSYFLVYKKITRSRKVLDISAAFIEKMSKMDITCSPLTGRIK